MPITPDSSSERPTYYITLPVSASSSENSTPAPPAMSYSSFDTDITDIDVDPFLKSLSQQGGSEDILHDSAPDFHTSEGSSTQIHEKSRQQNTTESEISRLPNRPNQSSGLMSLLSGKQSTKKKSKKLVQEEKMTETETDCDVSENFDNSFTETKSKQYRQDHDLLELEKKIYKSEVESVSAKDFFFRLKTQNIELPKSSDTAEAEIMDVISDNSIEVIEEPILISTDDSKDSTIDTKDLESKIYGDRAKVTSAKDFLQSLKPVPKKNKNKKESKSRFVTLKINSQSLAEIKRYDNPFKTKGNLSFQGATMAEKGSSTSNDFFARPKAAKASSSSSFFETMMSASKNSIKLTPLQKLKELEPPILHKSELHVYSADNLVHHNHAIQKLPPKVIPSAPQFSSNNLLDVLASTPHSVHQNLITERSKDTKKELLERTIPHYRDRPQLKFIVDRFFRSSNAESLVWPSLFQSEKIEDLMVDEHLKTSLKNWVKNSFARLKAQSLKNPRNVLLKQKKKKLQRSMDNFIVDDFSADFDGEETEEEIFVPVLILQGSIGSCKSSSIYAVMKDLDSYVHEINTGVNRGRKDIFNSLKEFCTTQLVHKQNESKKFQQGIVLLEDVNILFEQDKNFWSVVQDILNISRRPMVMTCESLQNIPKSLLELVSEEDSIINLDRSPLSRESMKEYLWVCALSQGFDLKDSLLNKILSENFNGFHYDLRKCLMECQFLCQARNSNPIEIEDSSCDVIVDLQQADLLQISIAESEPKKCHQDLETYSDLVELMSTSDILSSNTKSSICHQVQGNELIDIYLIDDSTKLTQPTLPFELNIGSHIMQTISDKHNISTSSPERIFNTNILREETNLFIGSRSKKRPKLIQDLMSVTRSTRSQYTPDGYATPDSNSSWTPEPTGIPETSFVNYITPSPLFLELLPFCRSWFKYQLLLNHYEVQAKEQGNGSIKSLLNYRDFQYETTFLLDTLKTESILQIISFNWEG